jgi:hypothetical protein
MAANNVLNDNQIKKYLGEPTKYVFSYDCTLNNIPIQDTFLTYFVDTTQTSCTRVIEDIRDNKYTFKTKHEFVIVYSERLNKYFCITHKHNYVYLLRKIIEHNILDKLISNTDSVENNMNGDDKIDLLITENECLRNTFKYNIYTLCVNDIVDVHNSIYNIFHNRSNPVYMSNGQSYSLKLHQIFNNMIEASTFSENSDQNDTIVHAPFVSFSLNSIGFPQKIVFFSQRKYIVDSIYYNMINNYNNVVINDTYVGLNPQYFQQFYIKKLGVHNYTFVHFNSNYAIEHKNVCDIYNKIDKSKYYVTFTKHNTQNIEQMSIIEKKSFNKYINTMRDDIILFRKQYRKNNLQF